MTSKEPSLSVKQAIIRLKKKNPNQPNQRPNQLFGTFLKRKNPPLNPATPKDLEDHGEKNCGG